MEKMRQKKTLLILVLVLVAGVTVYLIVDCPCSKPSNFGQESQAEIIPPQLDIPPISFFQEGHVMDREPDKFNQGLYLSYRRSGQPTLTTPLSFDEYSYCELGGQSVLCRELDETIDTSLTGKKVSVNGVLMSGNSIVVRKLMVQD